MLLVATGSIAQQPHYNEILKYAEERNPTLRAAAKRAEADKSAVYVGGLLPNPQVEANYFWSTPADIGIRWDFNVSQTFDMPSVLVRRARLRNLQEQSAELSYMALRRSILLEVQLLCADWVYYNALAYVWSDYSQSAIRLMQLYQKRYDAGDCSILEYNRAQMNLAAVSDRAMEANLLADHTATDIAAILDTAVCPFYQTEYEPVVVESSFESWYEEFEMRNPVLQQLDNQVAISHQQAQLSRAQWLPTMSVGYGSENQVGSSFKGIKVGLELPLWSQQRSVRSAQLELQASQQELTSKRTELYNRLRCMFHRHEALIRKVYNLKTAFEQYSSLDLLYKALEAGEISQESYIQQAEFYYDMQVKIWEAAHELEQLHIYLYSVEL